MKQIHFLTLMVAFGSLMLCACSSDDSTNIESENIAALRPLDAVASQLNQRLEGLDFKELDPLAETIASNTRAEGEASEFDVKLSALLTLLKGEEGNGVTLGRRFSYDAFNTALELAYDLSVILKDNGESSSSWFGLKADGRGEVTYTDRNGQQYHISAEMEKDISIYRWNFYVTGVSQFFIYKDNELVLRLISNTERNRPVWLPLLVRGNSFTGELLYHDFVVTLDYRQLHTHERSVVLTYGKTSDESPLLVMNTTLTDDADILKLIKHDVTVEADFTVSAIEDLFVPSKNRSSYIFQAFYYCEVRMIVAHESGETLPAIMPTLLYIKRETDAHMPAIRIGKEPIIDYQQMCHEEFHEQLTTLLSEIFDTAQPFEQTPDATKCEYCPFTQLCNRT